jgi:hypothetical protein
LFERVAEQRTPAGRWMGCLVRVKHQMLCCSRHRAVRECSVLAGSIAARWYGSDTECWLDGAAHGSKCSVWCWVIDAPGALCTGVTPDVS